jgi:DNA-binding transcriptional MerR regulator
VRIGELARRTGVPTRMLRYYEEQDLLHPERADNGYRDYDESAVARVTQIRGLLDSGLTTEIIRRIVPFLDRPGQLHPHPQCLTEETSALLREEADRIQARIDCMSRNLVAIRAYLAAVRLDGGEGVAVGEVGSVRLDGGGGVTVGEVGSVRSDGYGDGDEDVAVGEVGSVRSDGNRGVDVEDAAVVAVAPPPHNGVGPRAADR